MRITKKQDRMPGIILTILLFVAEIAFTDIAALYKPAFCQVHWYRICSITCFTSDRSSSDSKIP